MSRTEQMTDFDEREVSAAEADLEKLLSIEPSPEFIAKVRARIDVEPPVRRWSWVRLVLPLAAACAVLMVLVLRGGLNVQDDGQPFSNAHREDVVLSAPDLNAAKGVVPGPPAPVAVSPRLRRAALPQREPEVIIDPAVTDAIRRLAVAARNTMLDVSNGQSIAAPDSASDTLQVAEPLNVPELVLKPADQTGGQ
jgi:hypothetical protein